jgi:predicted metal-dependent hydrolase
VEVEISGRTFLVSTVPSANRNAIAKLRGQTIVISLPSRWPSSEKERVWKNLYKRAVRAIEKGKWRPENSRKIGFSDGQRIVALGNEFEIALMPHHKFRSRTIGRKIEVGIVEAHPERDERVSRLVRRELEKTLMPALRARVHEINRQHFGAGLGEISLRDNTSRWGSCSPDGSISLSIRLLFMPQGILDYVIVHELAHTRYRSHGPRFWALVEKAVPDHKERRKWLRENGWKYPESDLGQVVSGDVDEPY